MTKTLNIIAAKITSFTVFAWPTISSRSKGIPRLRKINDVVSQEKVPCLNRFILGREEESLFVTLIDTSVTVVVNKHLSAMMEVHGNGCPGHCVLNDDQIWSCP